MYFGTIGFFVFMMFLFIRFLPIINMFEIKDLWHRITGPMVGETKPVVSAPAGSRSEP